MDKAYIVLEEGIDLNLLTVTSVTAMFVDF